MEKRPAAGGEPCSDGRDRHTGAGSSVDRTEQGTRAAKRDKDLRLVKRQVGAAAVVVFLLNHHSIIALFHNFYPVKLFSISPGP